MIFSRNSALFLAPLALLLFVPSIAKPDVIFDFESDPSNLTTPFSNTVNGRSATFTGNASVCDSGGIFQSLSGNVLIQGFCGPSTETGPISLSFSSNLTNVVLTFATPASMGTLTLAAFEDGTAAGSMQFASTLPNGRSNGEGSANFSGMFNRLTLSSTSPLALDNIKITSAPVPEPASLGTAVLGSIGLLAALARRHKR